MRPLLLTHALKFSSRRFTTKMALHSAKDPSKLIFAPAGKQAHGQAEQFTLGTLTRLDLDARSPLSQFHSWFAAAQDPEVPVAHPETCCLSTASLPTGRVSARMVYLKELDAEGFVVYSNFGTSRKAADLATNPWASLTFWWEAMERQVRVEGKAERLTSEESQKYYDTRARGSRIGAWASRQSQVLQPGSQISATTEQVKNVADDGRAQLEGWVTEAEKKFEGEDKIPVPEFWGGLRIVPQSIEFWQGRQSRLHDRFVYTRKEGDEEKSTGEAEWVLERLSP